MFVTQKNHIAASGVEQKTISWLFLVNVNSGIFEVILEEQSNEHINTKKMTRETPEVRSDKTKPREDRQNHRYHGSHRLQFYENSSKHPKKITLLFYINNVIFDTGWTLYCIRSYLNAQRCTEPPENLIFQVVT